MDGRQPFKYEVPEYSKLVITGVTFFCEKINDISFYPNNYKCEVIAPLFKVTAYHD